MTKNYVSAANKVRLLASNGMRTDGLSAGRLEMFINNRWGTVCSNRFNTRDANVACRQLGFAEAEAFTTAADLEYVFAFIILKIFVFVQHSIRVKK